MNSDFKLTGIEQEILARARQLLGPSLVNFLLSGLGGTEITYCRAFRAQNASPESVAVAYRFEMRNESGQGLPVGRDPLVMAALIGMLRERQPMDDAVTFSVASMLETLRWPQGKESHLIVTRAVERYAGTSYCLIDQPMPEEEGIGSYFRRLVISYETVLKPAAAKVKGQQTVIRVQFWPYFINAFILARKHFLGVEFQTLRGIVEVPCGESGEAHAEGAERQ